MVEEARKADHTWAEIAEALGVTRQAAQARFGGRDSVDPDSASNRPTPGE